MTELTKVYRTADGRLFEKEDRDVARAHDAWLELLAWCQTHLQADKSSVVPDAVLGGSEELIAILKRKPTEAEPT